MSLKSINVSIDNIKNDSVKHPTHYTSHPSGIECIEVLRYMNFYMGSATKYIWRLGLKEDSLKDLKKAVNFLNYEIESIKNRSTFLNIVSKYFHKIIFFKKRLIIINPFGCTYTIDELIKTITINKLTGLNVALCHILDVGLKKNNSIPKLEKAIKFLKFEIEKMENK